ncbi:unnamed protein product [Arabidopsis halleri]
MAITSPRRAQTKSLICWSKGVTKIEDQESSWKAKEVKSLFYSNSIFNILLSFEVVL